MSSEIIYVYVAGQVSLEHWHLSGFRCLQSQSPTAKDGNILWGPESSFRTPHEIA
jgi:hypothetical protein